MGTVLYEVPVGFEWHELLWLIMPIAIALLPIIAEKDAKRKGRTISPVGKRITRICFWSGSLFVGVIVSIMLISQVCEYPKVVGAYDRGEYEIVEGYVENFDPMPQNGGSYESFEIDGVYFYYSDHLIQYGYNNAKCRGGVITGDGQYLKIGYVNTYSNGERRNIIVYIEEVQT